MYEMNPALYAYTKTRHLTTHSSTDDTEVRKYGGMTKWTAAVLNQRKNFHGTERKDWRSPIFLLANPKTPGENNKNNDNDNDTDIDNHNHYHQDSLAIFS